MAIIYELRRHDVRTRFELLDGYAQLEGLHGAVTPVPAGHLSFLVVARVQDGDRIDVAPPIKLDMTRNSVGYYTWFGRRLLPDGTRRAVDLAEGVTYKVRIESSSGDGAGGAAPRYGRVETEREGPDLTPSPGPSAQANGDAAIELPPSYAYPFLGVDPLSSPASNSPLGDGPTLLRGAVLRPDGRGWEGVIVDTEVSITGASKKQKFSFLTDETGQWVLALTGRHSRERPVKQDSVDLAFTFPDGSSAAVAKVDVVTGRATKYTQTALSGRAFDAQGRGLPDVQVTVDTPSDLETRSRADGSWSLHFRPGEVETSTDATVTARAPSGETETAQVTIEPRQITPVTDFRFAGN